MPNPENFTDLIAADKLPDGGHKVVKHGAKQILLLRRGDRVFACNNRCPHEGYPLSEGSVDPDCRLTCNWHNWKFRLADGENVTGGDHLRTYPVREAAGRIWLDLRDPPPAAQRDQALANLKQAVARHEYDRMAREIARFIKAGGAVKEVVAAAFQWTHEQLEFGATHALGAAPDWIDLAAGETDDPARALTPIVEILGNLSWDSLREPRFAFTDKVLPFDEGAFLSAIENEAEGEAVALVLGALAEGKTYEDLAPSFYAAALAHYNAFGHGAIYTVKTARLLRQLDNAGAGEILKSLIRMLTTARREDLIPEFRHYTAALQVARQGGGKVPQADDFKGQSARQAMDLTAQGAGQPEQCHAALLQVAAEQMLRFDLNYQQDTQNKVDDIVGWLDFTHAITFANAVRQICEAQPQLWPQGLLQMACFVGRNQAYVDPELAVDAWQVGDPSAFFKQQRRGLIDHGQFEYIVSAHLIKTLNAADEEVARDPGAAYVAPLTAAINRFLHSPLKRRHPERTARQALEFVARED